MNKKNVIRLLLWIMGVGIIVEIFHGIQVPYRYILDIVGGILLGFILALVDIEITKH